MNPRERCEIIPATIRLFYSVRNPCRYTPACTRHGLRFTRYQYRPKSFPHLSPSPCSFKHKNTKKHKKGLTKTAKSVPIRLNRPAHDPNRQKSSNARQTGAMLPLSSISTHRLRSLSIETCSSAACWVESESSSWSRGPNPKARSQPKPIAATLQTFELT